jgi:hypothetical protein
MRTKLLLTPSLLSDMPTVEDRASKLADEPAAPSETDLALKTDLTLETDTLPLSPREESLDQGHDWFLDCGNWIRTNRCQGSPYHYYCNALGSKRKVLPVYLWEEECESRRLSGAARIFRAVPGPARMGLGKLEGKEKGGELTVMPRLRLWMTVWVLLWRML